MSKKSLKINAILNATKTLMGIAFPLLILPYVLRVLGTVNVGKVEYANSIISYFILIAGLGVSRYAVREGAPIRDDKEHINKFVSEIFVINLLSTTIAVSLLGITLLIITKLQSYTLLISILSCEIIFTTLGVDWIFSIYEDYKYITIRSIFFQILRLILVFLLIKDSNDYIIYAGILSGLSILQNSMNYLTARKYCRISLKNHKLELKRHIKPILIVFSINIATTIYVSSDVTMIGYISGDYYVGLYTTATKVYSIIKQVLAAVIIVTVPRMSQYIHSKSKEKFEAAIESVLNILVLLLVPIMVGLITNSSYIIDILGGKEYTRSSVSLCVLSFALFFTIFSSFFSMSILLPMKKEKNILIATSISAAINLLLNAFFIPKFQEIAAAVTTVIAELTSSIIGFFFSKRYLHHKVIIINFFKCLFGSTLIVVVTIYTKYLHCNSLTTFIINVALSAPLYFLLEIILKNSSMNSLVHEIKGRVSNLRKK